MTAPIRDIPARYQAWIEKLRERGIEPEVSIDRLTPDGAAILHVWAPGRKWYDANLSFGVSLPAKGKSRFLGLTVFTHSEPAGRRVKSVSRAAISLDVYTRDYSKGEK